MLSRLGKIKVSDGTEVKSWQPSYRFSDDTIINYSDIDDYDDDDGVYDEDEDDYDEYVVMMMMVRMMVITLQVE